MGVLGISRRTFLAPLVECESAGGELISQTAGSFLGRQLTSGLSALLVVPFCAFASCGHESGRFSRTRARAHQS